MIDASDLEEETHKDDPVRYHKAWQQLCSSEYAYWSMHLVIVPKTNCLYNLLMFLPAEFWYPVGSEYAASKAKYERSNGREKTKNRFLVYALGCSVQLLSLRVMYLTWKMLIQVNLPKLKAKL